MTTGEDELARMSAVAFGRNPVVESERVRLLVECGLTTAGANTTLHWLQSGMSAAEAISFSSGQVQLGKVASLVRDRAIDIIHRMPQLFESTTTTPNSTVLESDHSETDLSRLRDKLIAVEATRTGCSDPAFGQRMATIRADAGIESYREWAIRDGWSREKFMGRVQGLLDRVVAEVGPAATQALKAAPTVLDQEGDPWAEIDQHLGIERQKAKSDEVSEADARSALYGTPKEG